MAAEKVSPGMAVILARINKKPDEASPPVADEAETPEEDSGETAAAEEIMSAFENKDAAALSEALESFIQICMNKNSSEEY